MKSRAKKKRIYNEQLLHRKRMSMALRRYIEKTHTCKEISKYIGLTSDEFRSYLESRFLPGMSWENYKVVWTVDHIVPSQVFDMTVKEERALCNNYNNLIPMFKKDNLMKDFNCQVSKMILDSMEQNEVVLKLQEKIKPYANIFDKYCGK